MKKLSFYLKLLVNWLLISVILITVYKILGVAKFILVHFNLMNVNPIEQENNSTFFLLSIVSIAALIFIFWLLSKFRKVIYETGTSSFFSEKNEIVFRSVGNGLIYYSAVMFIIKLVEKSLNKPFIEESGAYNLGRNFGQAISDGLPLVIIAVFLLIIAQLIKDGYELKHENDLTI